jgi:hypothetical protein
MTHQRPHGTELAALLHRGEQVTRAHHRLSALIQELLTAAAQAGDVRDDVAPDELASYCLNALAAAGSAPSEAAVHRLVAVTLAGLRPGVDQPAPRQRRPRRPGGRAHTSAAIPDPAATGRDRPHVTP